MFNLEWKPDVTAGDVLTPPAGTAEARIRPGARLGFDDFDVLGRNFHLRPRLST